MKCIFLLALTCLMAAGMDRKHHRHHHKHRNSATKEHVVAATNSTQAKATPANKTTSTEQVIVDKIKALEKHMDVSAGTVVRKGRILVNGPLPTDFKEVFAAAVAEATGCDPKAVHVLDTQAASPASFIQIKATAPTEVEVVYEAPGDVVEKVATQAADAESKLVNGALHSFLVADDDAAAASSGGLDIDTDMPYGELEPFGREDTAQELTDNSIQESDAMVDQLERAEVAEEKRSVFRALTRLRGAAITSFDGIARSQTGNIDEYNHLHKWRSAHPLHHLADEESDVSRWAFPSQAD